jgi:hypothetical protein
MQLEPKRARAQLVAVYQKVGCKVGATAAEVGVDRSTLQRWLANDPVLQGLFAEAKKKWMRGAE